jgi:hypothetical protein
MPAPTAVPSVSRGSTCGAADGTPAHQHNNQWQVARRIDRERGRDTGGGDDQATDGGSDAARDVEPHAVECHGARQLRARHHVTDGCLPCRRIERSAAADQEREQQQQPRRDQAKPRTYGERDRYDQHEELRREHDLAPIEVVGHRPATSDNSMIGSVADACTKATMSADCAIWIIIHEAPTDWISAPRLDSALAAQTPRNSG